MIQEGGKRRKVISTLIVLTTVFSVFTGLIPALADEVPIGEDMPIPSAMTLTADPEWIYINGDESLIIATVYDHENYTGPLPNMVVYFETSRGILRPVTYGESTSPTECWAVTNESGVAIAAVMPVEGSAAGNATVKAVTGKGDIWKEVSVEFKKADWRVVLFPDALSKATAVNEDVIYTIRVRNAGTAPDTYTLSIPTNEADHAVLNTTTVSLAANTSKFLTLTVRDSAVGRYNTTVRAASAHANWTITLQTVVREYGVNLTVDGGDHAEKTVAPGVSAIYLLTVENTGSDTDSYDLSIENLDGAAVAHLNRTSVLNLAAGAEADVLLTVSDLDESAYRVNVATTSQGHPSTRDTISTTTTVLIPPEPDLIITEIALNSGHLFGNASNEICATVKNNGTAAAGPFNVSFNIGVFYTEARVSGGLAAGATTVVCVTDPTLRNAGTMVTILVTADAAAEVNESNEANNEMSSVETIAADRPDLTVIEITPNFGLLYANASNEICATVKNLGGADVGAFNVSFVVDGFNEEVRIGAGLAEGEETTVCMTDPTLRNAGAMVTITVTADSGDEISETNEANNAMSSVETVAPDQSDLTVIEITPNFGLLYANASNEICATVKNLGGVDASAFNVSFVVDGFSEEVRIAGLLAGEETTVCVTDPTMRTEGEMVTITVTADAGGEISESNETNNAMSMIATATEGQPDLTVIEITPNFGLLYANTSNEICATVKNLDGADASAFNVSFAIDGFSEEVRIAGLLAGEETTVCVTDPTLRAEGEMVTITVTADAGDEISESNETNNAMSGAETVVGAQPDLTVIEITPNFGQLYANTSNEICATVKNLGGADASAFNVSFAIDGFNEEVRIAGLAAGAETEVCVTDPTLRAEGAMVTITVTTDAGDEISETNETNNALSREETVATGQPDLSDIEITPNFGLLYANASNEICATVKNLGVVAASAFNVSFAIDGFSDEVRIAGLAVGAETEICVTDPTLRTAGEMVTITVTADAGDEISESNETNNVQSIIMPVVAKVNGTVVGTITYACNGAVGIADVTVLLTQNGITMASTTTDGDGNYTFNNVVPGNYSVNASKQRLWNSSAAVMVPASITVTVDLQMSLKGDLNSNCMQADAGDVAMMKDASVRKIQPDWRFDLNSNGIDADAGDVAMIKDASVNKIVLL